MWRYRFSCFCSIRCGAPVGPGTTAGDLAGRYQTCSALLPVTSSEDHHGDCVTWYGGRRPFAAARTCRAPAARSDDVGGNLFGMLPPTISKTTTLLMIIRSPHRYCCCRCRTPGAMVVSACLLQWRQRHLFLLLFRTCIFYQPDPPLPAVILLDSNLLIIHAWYTGRSVLAAGFRPSFE